MTIKTYDLRKDGFSHFEQDDIDSDITILTAAENIGVTGGSFEVEAENATEAFYKLFGFYPGDRDAFPPGFCEDWFVFCDGDFMKSNASELQEHGQYEICPESMW